MCIRDSLILISQHPIVIALFAGDLDYDQESAKQLSDAIHECYTLVQGQHGQFDEEKGIETESPERDEL